MRYTPPPPEALERLKKQLGYSSTQMADLFAIATGRQWRRYTSQSGDPGNRRDMGLHMLFFAMARLELDEEAIERVLDRMRQAGAQFDLSAPAGEQEPSQD